jgi:hypothetical protein
MRQLLQSIKDNESFLFSSSGSIVGLVDDNEDDCYEILPPIQKSLAFVVKKTYFSRPRNILAYSINLLAQLLQSAKVVKRARFQFNFSKS